MKRLTVENIKAMTASAVYRHYGFAQFKDLSKWSEKSISTLQKWHKNQPAFFLFIVEGALARKLSLLDRINQKDINE